MMSHVRWFLGLDGGSTKTHCVLYDKAEDRLRIACGGPTNHEVLKNGMEDLPEAIGAIAFPLLKDAGIGPGDLKGASFGLGGVDMPAQETMISEILKNMGFRDFTLSNDAYLGIWAECNGWGISAVNGTGYSVAGISPEGDFLQIGGHGELTGDKGGSAYLVPAVTGAVYAQLFKAGPSTSLTAYMGSWLHVRDREDFCQAAAMAMAKDAGKADLTISDILYTAAGEGDAEALRILTECGRDYALSIRCAASSLKLPAPTDVILLGSHFTKCGCTRAVDVIRGELEREGSYNVRVISTAPVAGALFRAMESAEEPLPSALKNELRRRLRYPEKGDLK